MCYTARYAPPHPATAQGRPFRREQNSLCVLHAYSLGQCVCSIYCCVLCVCMLCVSCCLLCVLLLCLCVSLSLVGVGYTVVSCWPPVAIEHIGNSIVGSQLITSCFAFCKCFVVFFSVVTHHTVGDCVVCVVVQYFFC